MKLITDREFKELEKIRKDLHNYVDKDFRGEKFWRFEPLTSTLFRIVHRNRNFKWFINHIMKGK